MQLFLAFWNWNIGKLEFLFKCWCHYSKNPWIPPFFIPSHYPFPPDLRKKLLMNEMFLIADEKHQTHPPLLIFLLLFPIHYLYCLIIWKFFCCSLCKSKTHHPYRTKLEREQKKQNLQEGKTFFPQSCIQLIKISFLWELVDCY
jgi:hypothetical protein